MNKNFNPIKEINYIKDWIKNYFIKNGPNAPAIIGISGGKDSTIAAALLVEALGADRVIGVLMPEGTQEDIKDAQKVCEILNIQNYTLNISYITDTIYEEFIRSAKAPLIGAITSNTPARIRMIILYMFSSFHHGRVANTCNKSEDYVGFSTKYGDLAGDFSLFKNYTVKEIIAIGDALNLPEELVHKTPSDGLCGSTDEQALGFSYDVLDDFLIDGIIPSYDIYKNICERHERNIHKECINLPAPKNLNRHAYGRHGIYDYSF